MKGFVLLIYAVSFTVLSAYGQLGFCSGNTGDLKLPPSPLLRSEYLIE